MNEKHFQAVKNRRARTGKIRNLMGSERGQATVELALLLPFFAFLVFGTLEVGRMYIVQQHLNSAAYLGSQTGTIRNSTVANVRNALDTYFSSTEVGRNYSPTITGVSESADFNSIVTVSISYDLNLFSSLSIPGVSGITVPLSSSVTMRHQ